MLHTLSLRSLLLAAAAALAVVSAQAQTVIGIANLGPHPSIAKTIDGFKAEMARLGHAEGGNTAYVYSDANFTQALMPQMFTQITSQKPRLILTVTTSVSQVAQATVDKSIPIVFAMVTDPVKAGLVPSWDKGGARSTGASDMQDFDAVLAFGKKLFPHARRFGVLYNPGEVNDMVSTQMLQGAASKAGLEFRPVSVDAVGDIPQRAELLRGVDFLYVTGSNLVQSAIPAVAASMNRLGIPILSNETEFVKTGLASANYAVSLQSIGANAARLADQVLKGKTTVQLPAARPGPQDYVTTINRGRFKALGLAIPPAFDACDCFIN